MLYIDTSNIEEIKKYTSILDIQGITTNQKLLLTEKNKDIKKTIQSLLDASVKIPINIELTETSSSNQDLVREAIKYFDMAPKRIVIKIPAWCDGRGLKIAKELQKVDIPTNLTCCMSTEQVLLAALANVTYVSLFFRRIADYYVSRNHKPESAYEHACKIISSSNKLLTDYGFDTKLIIGSIREPNDVIDAYLNGADIVTVPPKILEQMLVHPKTAETIIEFDKAWEDLKKL